MMAWCCCPRRLGRHRCAACQLRSWISSARGSSPSPALPACRASRRWGKGVVSWWLAKHAAYVPRPHTLAFSPPSLLVCSSAALNQTACLRR